MVPSSKASRAARSPLENPCGALEHIGIEARGLDHRALGCQRSVQDRDAAGGVDRMVESAQHLCRRDPAARCARGSRPRCGPLTVKQSPCSRPASSSVFITTGTPPMRSTSTITCWPNGLTLARWGTLGADRGEILQRQLDPCLVCDGQQMQHRVGRAAERHHDCDRVVERLLGEDVASGDAAPEQLDDGLPAAAGEPVTAAIGGRRCRAPR